MCKVTLVNFYVNNNINLIHSQKYLKTALILIDWNGVPCSLKLYVFAFENDGVLHIR